MPTHQAQLIASVTIRPGRTTTRQLTLRRQPGRTLTVMPAGERPEDIPQRVTVVIQQAELAWTDTRMPTQKQPDFEFADLPAGSGHLIVHGAGDQWFRRISIAPEQEEILIPPAPTAAIRIDVYDGNRKLSCSEFAVQVTSADVRAPVPAWVCNAPLDHEFKPGHRHPRMEPGRSEAVVRGLGSGRYSIRVSTREQTATATVAIEEGESQTVRLTLQPDSVD